MLYTQNLPERNLYLKIILYTIGLFLLQANWVSCFTYLGMRVDLLLPLAFGVALRKPPIAGLAWAFIWGYIMDVLSGKLWGFHVVSYMLTAVLVYLGSQRMEFQNITYQVVFLGLCSIAQSVVLGLFMLIGHSSNDVLSPGLWVGLAVRSLIMIVLCPLIIHPLREMKKVGF